LKTLGDRMRALREERAWTQDGAGSKVHVSRVTIGKIEHGIRVLPKTFDKYAALYGTSLRQLIQDITRDDLDDESRDIGRRYRLAPTPVRQAITALLAESESKERK
jgi:DNA-binding XRE family transcriptional regulator